MVSNMQTMVMYMTCRYIVTMGKQTCNIKQNKLSLNSELIKDWLKTIEVLSL